MNAPAQIERLPAVLYAPDGSRRVDYRAVFAMAWPLVLNFSLQAILSLTDVWFLGRLSTNALAAVGAIHFLVFIFIMLLGGVGQAVQTMAAQAWGAGARIRAASYAWNGLWASIATVPIFLLLAHSGAYVLAPFGLGAEINSLALEFWFPRLWTGFLATALWGLGGFFNGIGRTRVALMVGVIVMLSNVVFNQLLIFEAGMGVAGSGWGTGAAQLVGVLVYIGLMLARRQNAELHSRGVWRPRVARVWRLFKLGVPMGMAGAFDIAGFAFFQLMLARVGAVESAASQVVMMLTSLCFMPMVGMGLVGTTLVGQSIGAGNREWARISGNAVIRIGVVFMGGMGLLLALSGEWVVPFFLHAEDIDAEAARALGRELIWIATAYQVFDALNMGCGFCLRGAGDVRFPAIMLVVLSLGIFVPATHMMTFAPGQGLVHFLPQFGLGAHGAWLAAVGYIFLLGTAMLLRWRSGAWKKMAV